MNWNIEFEDTQWKIESNSSVIVGDIYFYSWGKSFLKITCKDVSVQSVLTVDGEDYEFYADNEFSIIEITDMVRSSTGGTINFVDEALTTILALVWLQIVGEKPTTENINELPFEIPFVNSSTIPFYIQVIREMYVKTTTGWSPLSDGDIIESFDMKLITGFDNQVRTTDTEPVYTDFIDQDCTSDKILVEWVGRFGALKSWWFTVERVIYGSDRKIDIQTMDNGYNTLKNKRTALILLHRKADQRTQAYLSDLVLSDDVYVYTLNSALSKHKIRVENNSFEVTQRKRDIQFTLNTFAYDTI